MKSLTVLYDSNCGLCCRAVRRLLCEPTYLSLRFAPAAAPQVRERFAEAFAAAGGGVGRAEADQLIVVADTGELYKGPAAWIMVLYALRRYRPLAMRLASPTFKPLAAAAIAAITRHRLGISEVLGFAPDTKILVDDRDAITRSPNAAPGMCENGACDTSGDAGTRLDSLIKARQRVRAEWGENPPLVVPPPIAPPLNA